MDDEISDENLMLSYCSGDTEAFEVLYQRHKGPLYRFILRQCGRVYADELYQDTWLKVINSRTSYKAKASFKTWLYHIARNRVIDHYRRQNVRPLENNPDSLSSLTESDHRQPENNLESDRQHELVLRAIAGLPADQKEAFLLKEEAGLSIDEIAATTGVTYEAAKSRLRYAYRKLRAQLEIVHGH